MRALPAAAGAIAVLGFFAVFQIENLPGWVAWAACAAGAVTGEIIRRTW